jgi:RNA polymerase sigma factor (sigma-70 family)
MTPLFAAKQQSGDKAFERLYKAHVNDVYRYALMVLRNPADAEDVAQTTFMNAYRAMQRGEHPRAPRHWLIAIAHNVCRSRLRDLGRRPQQVELEDYHVATTDDGADGVDPKELVDALGALSFNQRSALVMRELEGRTYAEIAEILEVSPSAVETLLFRARRAVREQLEGSLSCGDAELALSKQLDGRLDAEEKRRLRAHLRACKECAGLARRERARSAALRGLFFPLPSSLASWGGGVAVGTGLAAKAAAVVAASVAAAGVAHQAAEAVSNSSSPERAAVRRSVTMQSARPPLSSRAALEKTTLDRRKQKRTPVVSQDSHPPGAPGAAGGTRGSAAADATPTPIPGALPTPQLPGVEVPPLPVQVPKPPPVPVNPPELPPVAPPELPELPPLPPPPPLPPVQPPTVPAPVVPSLLEPLPVPKLP